MRHTASGSLISPVRLAYGLIPLFTVLEKRGIDTDKLLDLAAIPRFALVDPKYTMTFEQELIISNGAMEYLTEPHASLEVGAHCGFNTFSVLGLAMQSCANISDMSETLFSYPRLAWGASDFETYENDEFSLYRMMAHPSQGPCEQFMKERDLSAMLNLNREAASTTFRNIEIRLAFPAPGSIKPYEAFFRCPVLFNCEFTETISAREQGSIPISSASPMAKEFYLAQCAELVESMNQPFSYAISVEDRLRRTVPIPDLEMLARKMSLAPRTLQRRLMSENVTFSDLLKKVRLQQAKEMLNNAIDSLQQIAWKLGFNDAVAFSHAFKRWTSESPGAWRESHRVTTKNTQ